MKKFDYTVMQYNDSANLEASLKICGDKGWELVSTFLSYLNDKQDKNLYLFAILEKEKDYMT